MVEYDRTQERDMVASTPLKICVAGIGGAGLNVLDRITLDRIVDATLVSMHTDIRVLSHAMAPHKIQLPALSSRPMCVRMPVKAKKAGRKSTATKSPKRRFSSTAIRLSCGMMAPRRKAPKNP